VSAIPTFEIGVWNVWIFMLCHSLIYLPLILVQRGQARELETPHSELERRLYPIIMVLWILALIYSIFLPLRLGTIWLYVGLPVFILGLIGQIAVCVSMCTTPIDEKPVTSGIYQYSRHPYYITQFILFIGVGIASASWVFLVFSIVYSVLHFIIATPEEQHLLKKYGDAYYKYMNRTPRWIGIPKS